MRKINLLDHLLILLDEVFSELSNYDTWKMSKDDGKDDKDEHHGIGWLLPQTCWQSINPDLVEETQGEEGSFCEAYQSIWRENFGTYNFNGKPAR